MKVVKQWLVEYLDGEISHIENVLKGEFAKRSSRQLDKTQDVFSTTTTTTESTSNDTESTDRFELKREAESSIKTQLGVGASSNFTYNGAYIVANVSANFSYKRLCTKIP
jgi:hypothetical protein